ncbi:MAG: hypothetical protein NTY90_04565, partial [Candidatus Micrarchaeota archaeon]|nr:hypothetical protein [Candidatus Micrarchaeota archaeon]
GVNQDNYADVSISSDRLDLSNNQQISGHGYWRAVLAQTPYSGSGTSPALAGIGVFDTSGLSANLKAGESYNLITNQPALSFTYSGMETVDLDPLTFVADTSPRPLANGSNTNTPSAYWLQVSSGRTDAFKNDTLGITSSQVLVVLNSTDATYVPRGAAYAFDSTAGYYKRINPTAGTIPYYYSTTECSSISVANDASAWTTGGTGVAIVLPEIIREAGLTSALAVPSSAANYGFFAMKWDPTLKHLVNQYNTSTIDTAYYNNSETPTSLVSAKSVYYSPRGTKLGAIGTTNAQFNYATKLVYADYYLQAATTGASTTGATRQVAKVGDTIDMGSGYSVKVVGIDCSAAGGGTCGTATGLDTLAPSEPKAMVVKALDTSASPLVITDANAGAYAQLIVVGGPAVNTVAKDALGDGAITSATEAMVKVVGSKVVVAGYSAADTQAAANALIKWLSDNRDAIVR